MGDLKNKLFKELKKIEPDRARPESLLSAKRPVLFLSDTAFSPPTDVWETDEEICIVVEIANLGMRYFNVQYSGGSIFIEGHRDDPSLESDSPIIKYHKKEIDSGAFKMKIKMNTRIFQQGIKAEYKKGMLFIRLPKNVQEISGEDVEIPVRYKWFL